MAFVALFQSGIDLPSLDEIGRVALLLDYNTRLVVLSTTLLGVASGLIGSFLLLRKRSLMGDALSHATLPGIALAFMAMVLFAGTSGKDLPALLAGAAATGVLGVLLVLAIRNTTRLKDDAAMGIVLSVFFGLGVALLGLVQEMPQGSAAGLESFIYGKTASMVWQDCVLISVIALKVTLLSLLLFKEFTLVCFDDGFAGSQGWPVLALDVVMLGLVAAVTVVGLQAVGLILIIAFLITPAAAARFWTHCIRLMMLLAAVIGGVSGWGGAALSALLPRLPAGAVIVLVAAAIFLASMILGPARGVLVRTVRRRRLNRRVGRQHLLRGAYELLEARRRLALPETTPPVANEPVRFDLLLAHRSWTPRRLRSLIRRARRRGLVESFDGQTLRLSEGGFGEAARVTRNHRLWEMFLMMHADVAPGHVDRDADTVEHVLGAEMVRKLEAAMRREASSVAIPESPHVVTPEA